MNTLRRKGTIRRSKPDRRYHDRRNDEERRNVPSEKPTKILVTGDRDWNDIKRVVEVLEEYGPGTILIHGACRGADVICAAVGEALGFVVRDYPADWDKYKKGAGPVRNRQMLKEEHVSNEPFDICIAFHNDIENSKGTKDMMTCAKAAGIKTILISSKAMP